MIRRSLHLALLCAAATTAAGAATSTVQPTDATAVPPDVAVFFEEDAAKPKEDQIKSITELPKTPSESVPTDPAIISNPPTVAPTPIIDWHAESINDAQWSVDIDKGQLPVFLKAQILLSRLHASPGAIDGTSGRNMLKAISAFEFMNGLPVDGKLDTDVWALLETANTTPVMTTYTLTSADLGPYPSSIPHDYALQAKMPSLAYTSVAEMLGERFHTDVEFLKMINAGKNFNKVGETLLVPDLGTPDTRPINLLVAIKKAGQLYGFDSNNKMIATFPATIGSDETPSPTGKFYIKVITPRPWYSYNPKNFIQGNNLTPLQLPPGPNNPVGLVWMGLSKPSFGIHGTPSPSKIDKTRSHGCVRLTNWDVEALSKRVVKGVQVYLQ